MGTYRLVLLIATLIGCISCEYQPTWESLDTRPLPQWYDEAKVGIFIHWGVFSVPSFGSEWFWQDWQGGKAPNFEAFMNNNYRPNFTYADFGPMFTAEFYNPDHWADIFNASGAQYIVLTSKHHEGFTLWPSKYSWNWNAMDVGPKRDLLGDLANSIRTRYPAMHFGLYHSLYEWFNPLYLQDKANEYKTNDFVSHKTMPELYELVNTYKPEVIWSDGDWEGLDTYWNSTEFIAWLFNSSPVKDTVVTNDRWGRGVMCNHGSFYTCSDRYNPGVLQKHKWENCMTLDEQSWGYRRNASLADYLTLEDLLKEVSSTVACGGNILINVGPTHDGRIAPIMEERLRQLGSWLQINGEAIYSSVPWAYQNDTITSGVWYTAKSDKVYATVLSWPEENVVRLGKVQTTPDTKITMLGYDGNIMFKSTKAGVNVAFPPMSKVKSKSAWVLVFSNIKPN